MEESVGVNRQLVNLIGKVIPKCKHYVSTAHGVSNNYHGGHGEIMGGTGQGNVFYGNVCRDALSLTFKEIEKRGLGVKITSAARRKEFQRVVIAFVDDSDFIASGQDSEEQMNEIIATHVNLHEATSGKIQHDKVVMCSHEWDGEKATNANAVVTIGSTEVKRLECTESIKTLGVHIEPNLT